jgi:aspartate racemase
VKAIGLLGGRSGESTVPHYQIINRKVGERLGGLHSTKLALHSVDFHGIERLQHAEGWREAGDLLADDTARIHAEAAAEYALT